MVKVSYDSGRICSDMVQSVAMTERLVGMVVRALEEGERVEIVFWDPWDNRREVVPDRLVRNAKGDVVAMYLNGGGRYGWVEEPSFFFRSELVGPDMVTWSERAVRIKNGSWKKGFGSTRPS